MTPSETSLYHLLFKITGLIAEHPDQVSIHTLPADNQATFSICMHPEDVARFKADDAQIEKAIQTVVDAITPRGDRQLRIMIHAPE